MADAGAPIIDVLPMNMSSRARLVAFAAYTIRAGEPGEIPGGQRHLRAVAGYLHPESARLALVECEAHRILKRVQFTRRQRVFFLGFRGSQGGICPTCGLRPVSAFRGAKACDTCRQVVARREWQDELVCIWAATHRHAPGSSDDLLDWRAARRAAAILKRGLWTQSEEGRAGTGSGEGEGVIAAGVRLGIFAPEMLEYDPRRADE